MQISFIASPQHLVQQYTAHPVERRTSPISFSYQPSSQPHTATTSFLSSARLAQGAKAAATSRLTALRAVSALVSDAGPSVRQAATTAVLTESELKAAVERVQSESGPSRPSGSEPDLSSFRPQHRDGPTEEAGGAARSASVQLRLKSAVACLPHPDKAKTGGEDAYFIADSGLAIGVSDGVGAWADENVDSGVYSRGLMSAAKFYAERIMPCQEAPQGIMHLAHQQVFAKGSATALIAVLEKHRLHSANLGDSCLVVLRGADIRFRAPVQQRGFNCPYQLASPRLMGYTRPRQAAVRTVDVAPGDVVVAGTDGLWDNVFMKDCATLLHDLSQAGDGPEEMANKLALYARTKAADPNYASPFALKAREFNIPFYGGKMDDITIVVSVVTEQSML